MSRRRFFTPGWVPLYLRTVYGPAPRSLNEIFARPNGILPNQKKTVLDRSRRERDSETSK